jgi:Dolichyl-phosphate-mannose-protein mannosyltransferase
MKFLKIFILITALFYIFAAHKFEKWNRGGENRSGVLNWDVYGYSFYLSSIIHNDGLTLNYLNQIDSTYQPCDNAYGYGRFSVPNSKNSVNKYTIGNAYFYAPFYFSAHFVNQWFFRYKRDGYSTPYSVGLCVGWIFWALWGLYLLGLFLIRYFSTVATITTLLIIATATNFYAYTVQTVGMNHIPLFFCLALSLYTADNWAKKGQISALILFALSIALAIVLRPTEIILLTLLPALFVLINQNQLSVISFITTRYKQILAAVLVGALVISPQIIYWYATTGKFIHYSYQGEGFDFANPQLYKGFFSYRKGVFVYAPALIFAILGIPFLFIKNKPLAACILAYLCINSYIIFSWTAWTYGGSFGARSMIQSYVIFAVFIAAFFDYIFKFFNYQNIILKRILYFKTFTTIIAFIYLNIIQTIQYDWAVIHWDNMNKQAYWYVFAKINLTEQERNHINHLYSLPVVD